MENSPDRLILNWNVDPSDASIILYLVIDMKIIFDSLIINGTNGYGQSFWNSEFALDKFWEMLGKTVTRLELHGITNEKGEESYIFQKLNNHFREIREIIIETSNDLSCVSLEFLRRNKKLESIIVIEPILVLDFERSKEKVHEKFIDILTTCKSLKNFTFGSYISLEANTISGIFSEINLNHMKEENWDEIVFDCHPLPSLPDYVNFIWMVRKLKMEFERNPKGKLKLFLKPLEIQEEIMVHGRGSCLPICTLDHQIFKSESVTKVSLMFLNKCHKYYEALFKSFPCTLHISFGCACDEFLLYLMSKYLSQLQFCKLWIKDNPETWPTFSNLTSMQIYFRNSTYTAFETFAKSCLSLLDLDVSIGSSYITTDDCIETITRHLEHIEKLKLTSGTKWLTRVGLAKIARHFKELKHLKINCYEGSKGLFHLFYHLPKLELVVNLTSSVVPGDEISMTRTQFFSNQKPKDLRPPLRIDHDDFANKTPIVHLPNEILERIFMKLTKKQQMRCCQVCKGWFDIISSSHHIDRTLNLRDLRLSANTNPANIYKNTKFKYNRIVINEFTSFDMDDDCDLVQFWSNIGLEIVEICFAGRDHYTMTTLGPSGTAMEVLPNLRNITMFDQAFKTGLSVTNLPKLRKMSFRSVAVLACLIQNTDFQSLIQNLRVIRIEKMENTVPVSPAIEVSGVDELHLYNLSLIGALKVFEFIVFPKLTTFVLWNLINYDFENLWKTNINFQKITRLFLGKEEIWTIEDFKMIIKNCTNLKCLAIGFNKKHSHEFQSDERRMHIKEAAQLAFDQLFSLSEVSFAVFEFDWRIQYSYLMCYERKGLKDINEVKRNFFKDWDFLKEHLM